MARYTGPVCRLCRREGMKLFLKGDRCYNDKCAIERRNYPPGQHGRRAGRSCVGYGIQLREKQKVKRIYGVLENQFRRYFEAAERHQRHHRRDAAAGARARLDNVVYRLGFATSRPQARQLVRHGHVTVNGKKVNIPSYARRHGRRGRSRSSAKSRANERRVKARAIETAAGAPRRAGRGFDADARQTRCRRRQLVVELPEARRHQAAGRRSS